MTSPINDFQDILDAMERDPALRDALRRHILTEELLQVPARLERIEGDIAILKESSSRMEGDIAILKESSSRMEGDIAILKESSSRMEGDITILKEDVSRIGGDVSRLRGTDYESHVATYVHRFLRRNSGINARVFSTQRDRSALTGILDEAEARGFIEARETDELDRADLVLTADGPTDYLLAEVSITIQQDDVDRATERARLLAKATTRTVTPLAIGAREEPDLRRGQVQVVLIPEPQAP